MWVWQMMKKIIVNQTAVPYHTIPATPDSVRLLAFTCDRLFDGVKGRGEGGGKGRRGGGLE